MLDKEEFKRYTRQIMLPLFGTTGQEHLKAAKVLVVGAGGLGCPVLQYLTAAGVGNMGIADDDVVDISNLHRQILYTSADVGNSKAHTARQKLQLLNPHVTLTSFNDRITLQNAEELIKEYDFVIDGSDNFTTRYVVNDACVKLGKPLVFGSVFKFEGNVSVFNLAGGPNYRDIFPTMPMDTDVPNCAEIGVLGVLPGIIGLYMANEAIKIICGIGEILSGKLLTINLLENTIHIFKIKHELKADVPAQISIAANPNEDNEITLDELNSWLAREDSNVCLVDVREEYEFEDYNIGGINIPLYDLTDRINDIAAEQTVVVCCQSGQRSKMAVQLLKPLYKGTLFNLKDGIGR
jgi:molybdopterin/thiamine biosynthesis adenylyltransferase/rhodanese-related sulfurtransferase